MVEAIEAPFPFLIGVQDQIFERAQIDISEDITVVNLDNNSVVPMDCGSLNQMFRGFKVLRDRLIRAT